MIHAQNKVSIFTPIQSAEHPWIKYPALYLSPFSRAAAVAVEGHLRADGSRGALRARYQASWVSTALKIGSYILSAGILPLLALIALAAIRTVYKFHWINPRRLPAENPESHPEVVNALRRLNQADAEATEHLRSIEKNAADAQRRRVADRAKQREEDNRIMSRLEHAKTLDEITAISDALNKRL